MYVGTMLFLQSGLMLEGEGMDLEVLLVLLFYGCRADGEGRCVVWRKGDEWGRCVVWRKGDEWGRCVCGVEEGRKEIYVT